MEEEKTTDFCVFCIGKGEVGAQGQRKRLRKKKTVLGNGKINYSLWKRQRHRQIQLNIEKGKCSRSKYGKDKGKGEPP